MDLKNTIVLGSEVKLKIQLGKINNLSMNAYDFSCRFYVHPSKFIEVKKSDMIQVSPDEYIACLDTTNLCVTGKLMMMAKAEIPDSHFYDGLRTDYDKYETPFNIVENELF